MYSYEDRIRAVRLYLKLGKRIRATIRQLGYPTKNSLISWHQQYERLLDLPAGYSRPQPKYSDDQKAVAVEHYRSHGCCMAFTIRALGYPGRGLLTTWVREAYPEAVKRVVGKTRSPQHELSLKQAAVVELCTRDGSALAIATEVVDVSHGFENGGMFSNWAKKAQEVLIKDFVPPEAITIVP